MRELYEKARICLAIAGSLLNRAIYANGLSEEVSLRWCGDPAGKEVHACACMGAVNCCGPKGLTYNEWLLWLRWKEEQCVPRECPFCGGEASLRNNGGGSDGTWRAWIGCDSCHAKGPEFSEGAHGPAYRVKAQLMWNRRLTEKGQTCPRP